MKPVIKAFLLVAICLLLINMAYQRWLGNTSMDIHLHDTLFVVERKSVFSIVLPLVAGYFLIRVYQRRIK